MGDYYMSKYRNILMQISAATSLISVSMDVQGEFLWINPKMVNLDVNVYKSLIYELLFFI